MHTLLAVGPAFADAPAALRPLHDVDVTYKVPVPGTENTALLQRVRWSASMARARMDLPTSGNWMMLDFSAHRLFVVRDADRTVVEQPAPAGAGLPGIVEGGTYARAGTENLAGQNCTEWRTTDGYGRQSIACLTADGVLLSARAGTRILLQALSVQATSQDRSVFTVPADYGRRVLPP